MEPLFSARIVGALAALAFLNLLMEASTALIIFGLRKSKGSTDDSVIFTEVIFMGSDFKNILPFLTALLKHCVDS
jgi:hypothetical protein